MSRLIQELKRRNVICIAMTRVSPSYMSEPASVRNCNYQEKVDYDPEQY